MLLAWLLPASQVVVPVLSNTNKKLCKFSLKGFFCYSTVNNLFCVISKVAIVYGSFVFINCIFLPMMFILFTYIKILIITYHSSRDVRKKAAQTCLPHLLVLVSVSFFSSFDFVLVRVESDLPKTAHLLMTLQLLFYHPLINPIIYGLKMKEISNHLKKL
ncbi:hypothetical protein LDENG_00201470, partial [Lucifuga dentata]